MNARSGLPLIPVRYFDHSASGLIADVEGRRKNVTVFSLSSLEKLSRNLLELRD